MTVTVVELTDQIDTERWYEAFFLLDALDREQEEVKVMEGAEA